MEPGIPGTIATKSKTEAADALLDLGDIEPARASSDSDEFVLDLDDAAVDDAPAYAAASAYEAPMRAFVEPQVTEAPAPAFESTYQPVVHSSFADTQDVSYAVNEIEPYEAAAVPPELTPDPVPVFGATEFPIADTPQHIDTPQRIVDTQQAHSTSSSMSTDQLSPEMIDAIARRAVELMSDKVIREIAWEVVPDLAELLIKRQLEERQAN
jgi:hypothetical protein